MDGKIEPDGGIDDRDDSDRGESGGDVARNPDTIQREIEQTRAELADTIDAIADRISPKRAASRGAAAVKAQVSSVLGGGGNGAGGSNGHGPAAVLDGGPAAAAPGGAAYTGTREYRIDRRLRTDRVLLVVGAAAAVAGVAILWRSRRR